MSGQKSLREISESLRRIEGILARHLAPPAAAALEAGECWRWQATALGGELSPQPLPAADGEEALRQLVGLDEQVAAVDKNTRQFLDGRAANHVLLTGARGCGKSSVVRGVFQKYRARGLRLIETDANGLARLPQLQELLAARPEKYILYCDDLSFGESDQLFARIKSAVDGALSADAGNALIYATSNRRNLIAENYRDNLSPLTEDGGDIHPLETQDEKIALSDRFGLWLSFYAPDGEQYDAIAARWLRHYGIAPTEELRLLARRFADQRGSRNGRIARQFAISRIP